MGRRWAAPATAARQLAPRWEYGGLADRRSDSQPRGKTDGPCGSSSDARRTPGSRDRDSLPGSQRRHRSNGRPRTGFDRSGKLDRTSRKQVPHQDRDRRVAIRCQGRTDARSAAIQNHGSTKTANGGRLSGSHVADHPDCVLTEVFVGAVATAAVPLPDVAALRASPVPPGSKPVALKHMKHADEQTVVGISALLHAVQAAGWNGKSFDDWGAIGVPRFVGRMSIAFTVSKSLHDPSWSVSPNVIPNQSLHSLSGTISLALGLHGPNFGVGGGHNAVAEGLLTALSVMQTGRHPGLWVVLTQFDPEPCPDENGLPSNSVTCRAAALALLPAGPGRGSLKLVSQSSAPAASMALPGLLDFLAKPSGSRSVWRSPVSGV